MIRRFALAATLIVLVTGCATRASYHRMRADVETVRGDMTELRHTQEATARDVARAMTESRALAARVAEMSTALEDGTVEVARLRARVEAAEAQARAAEARAQAAATPPPVPPAAPASPRPAERPREPAPRVEHAEQAYHAALTTFRAREHGQAVLDFLDFIAKHPKHPLVANAQYWIGEAYYLQRDYRQALAEFQKVLEVAPASPKAADALLKIGLAHRQLRDVRRARQNWQRVVRDFPKSEAAVKARVLLR
ncbi:MAG TPA: tol-pal system protein YbgF [Methylomirabilota bacterium]